MRGVPYGNQYTLKQLIMSAIKQVSQKSKCPHGKPHEYFCGKCEYGSMARKEEKIRDSYQDLTMPMGYRLSSRYAPTWYE
jgi:hypothetical protein